MRIIGSLIIFLFLVASCSLKDQGKKLDDSDTLNKIKKHFNININSSHSVYVCIPIEGCNSCITPAIKFARDNPGMKNVVFIISDFGHKRILIEFPKKETGNSNIIADSEGYLYKINLLFNSPVVIFQEDNKFTDKVILTSVNSKQVFNRITEFTKTN